MLKETDIDGPFTPYPTYVLHPTSGSNRSLALEIEVLATPKEARDFAVTAHSDQKYGNHPYVVHLDAVAEIASHYGETAQIVSYLHDVVEDTPVTSTEVRDNFGDLVAECVSLLTDEPGSNRKERKAKTYQKLAQVAGTSELSLIVKAADRLANVRACINDKNLSLLEMYRSEQQAFQQAAYRVGLCEPIWSELESRLGAPAKA